MSEGVTVLPMRMIIDALHMYWPLSCTGLLGFISVGGLGYMTQPCITFQMAIRYLYALLISRLKPPVSHDMNKAPYISGPKTFRVPSVTVVIADWISAVWACRDLQGYAVEGSVAFLCVSEIGFQRKLCAGRCAHCA